MAPTSPIGPDAAGRVIGADALVALAVQPVAALAIHSGSARRWLVGGALAFALHVESLSTTLAPLPAARLTQGAGFVGVAAALIARMVEVIPPGMSGRAFGWTSLVRLVPMPWCRRCSTPPVSRRRRSAPTC